MNACAGPTGVTRHALGQAIALADRSDVRLTTASGRINAQEGKELWNTWTRPQRRMLPLRTRDMLRLWRVAGWPAVERWTDDVDWVYCPAEYLVATRRARLAVTSHDIRQDLEYGDSRRRALLRRVFDRADLVLSVSHYNTSQLLDAFPGCAGKTALVPNAAEDLFFGNAAPSERAGIRANLGIPAAMPYLLSVANFQTRKNLPMLLRAAGRLDEVQRGDLAIVLIGAGSAEQSSTIRSEIASLSPRAIVALPGYREGKLLRAAYAEASALVFPSLCESFGIPAVEAMAQGCPVALANSTALPEIAGDAGWYFDPKSADDLAETLRTMLDHPSERQRRGEVGLELAARFRWGRSCDLLVEALRKHR